jgi:hypothetical protein
VMNGTKQGVAPAGTSARCHDNVEECAVAFLGDHICVVMMKRGVPRQTAGRIGCVEDAGGMLVRLGVCWRCQPNILKRVVPGVF